MVTDCGIGILLQSSNGHNNSIKKHQFSHQPLLPINALDAFDNICTYSLGRRVHLVILNFCKFKSVKIVSSY